MRPWHHTRWDPRPVGRWFAQTKYLISPASSMILAMEDAHAAILDLDGVDGGPKPKADRTSFFAVYDGHGGSFSSTALDGMESWTWS